MSFSNLHQHSDASLFDAFAKIDDIPKRAKELGYPACALTDHGVTTALVQFYKSCKKEGIKPILGYEGYFTIAPEVKSDGYYHILLLAKDLTGYRNILRMSTWASEHFYRKPRLGLEPLVKYHEGVIVTTACIAGIFGSPDWEEIRDTLKKVYKDDFYLEIQPHNFQEQKDYNQKILQESKKQHIPYIITLDSHYCWPDDIQTHRKWLQLGEDDAYYSSRDFYMMGEDEVRSKMKNEMGLTDDEISIGISGTNEIVDKCNVEIPFGETHYPTFDKEDPEKFIRNCCNKGYVSKGINKKPNKQVYIDEVLRELKILNQVGYLNYFCIIKDMLNFCEDNNIPTGVGRGSVGGSCVAYLMNITDVDPIENKLIFERFANPERVTPADIDTDFPSADREKVIEYLHKRWGGAYHVRTLNYLDVKGAIKRAGQALGRTPSDVNKISKNTTDLDQVKDKELRTLAEKFIGHIQSYGMHASAVMVFPSDPCNWTAIEKQKGNMVVAQDFHLLEEQGLLKLDCLAIDQIDIMQDCLKIIGKNYGFLHDIPPEDKLTHDMLEAGKTMGVFQLSSPLMKNIIHKTKAYNRDGLMNAVALGRPGPLDSGMVDDYIKRVHGEPIPKVYPAYDNVVKDTQGIILYQEEIMQIARDVCGYSLGEADILRKIIGRKIVNEMDEAMEEFTKRGKEKGVPDNVLKFLTDAISKSGNYIFNKSHAAAYGITAWRTAYLKAHYPAEYMCAMMNHKYSDRDKFSTIINEAREMGVTVNPPGLYKECTVIYVDGKPSIFLGINIISNVGNYDIDKLKYPEKGKIGDGESYSMQFIECNKGVSSKVLLSFIKAGVLRGNRNKLIEYTTWVKDKRKSKPPFSFSGIDKKTDGEYETEVIGYSFVDIFKDFDQSIVDNVSNFIVMVNTVKPWKTKKGKPMYFVGCQDKQGKKNLVIFDERGKDIQENSVYVMRIDGTIIRDFIQAKRK